MRREERLVGGHDVGAGIDRLQQVRARGLDAAHELDHDVGADDEGLGIRREELARQVDLALRVEVAHGDAGEFERRARAVGELVTVTQQERGDLGADGSGAEEGHPQAAIVGHALPFPEVDGAPASRASRSSIVSPRTMMRALPPRTATTGARGT